LIIITGYFNESSRTIIVISQIGKQFEFNTMNGKKIKFHIYSEIHFHQKIWSCA